ncbi:pilus assembly protein PilM [Candidatus Kaiserbacteria bacterium]|nr:pilus assembly protein PilM [Candidatus Kaiserbacteria bacterium]
MENPLDSVKNFFSSFNLGGRGGGSILGIDIGSSSIKVVQLKKTRGVAVLETYGELSLGPYAELDIGRATNLAPAKLIEALRDILNEANTTTTECGVSIPFSASLISTMSFPGNIEETQLARMIPIEARKYIPVPISEVTLDWFVIPNNQNKYLSQEDTSKENKIADKGVDKSTPLNQTSVLLVAIHNSVLNKYREVLQGAGLSVSFYEIEIFSTVRASVNQGIEPIMIVDIGAAATKVYVVEFGIVKISHIINKGSQDLTLALSRSLGVSVTEAEKLKREIGLIGITDKPQIKESILLTLEHIFSESNRVLLNYQRKYNRSVSKVLFTGGGAVLKGLKEEAVGRFNTEVTIADPFSKTQTPAFLEEVLKEVGPEFAVAVGVALRKLQELD